MLLRSATYEEYLFAHPGLSRTMRARSREIRIDADDQYTLSTFTFPVHFVVVASPTHRDTPVVLPVLEHIRRCLLRCSFWVVESDVWSRFARCVQEVPNSRHDVRSGELPLLFILDAQLRYLGTWGPQPEAYEVYLQEWTVEETDRRAETRQPATADMIPMHVIRLWYNSGLNVDCAAEIRSLLETISANIEGSEDVEDDNVAVDL